MSETANLRAVRVQYLVLDTTPVSLRGTRLQYAGEDSNPASIRRINGQVLMIDKQPVNVRAVRVQHTSEESNPASIRRINGQYLLIDKQPVNFGALRAQYLLIDKQPVNVKGVRAQFVEDTAEPASIRRINGQYLLIDKQPVNFGALRAQYLIVDKQPLNVSVLRTQFVEDTAEPTSIRRIAGQTMLRKRDPLPVRAVRVQYAEVDNDLDRYDFDPRVRLLKIINSNNGLNLQDEDIVFGIPQPATVPNKWNTQVEIEALESSTYSGKTTVYFQRYDVSRIFRGKSIVLDLTDKVGTHDLIPQINESFNTAFTEEDLEDIPIDHELNRYTIKVISDHWFFLKDSEYDHSNALDLSIAYSEINLPGFNWDETIIAAVPGRDGIYEVKFNQGVVQDTYVNMTIDGGRWVQVLDWVNSTPGVNATFNDTVASGQLVKGYAIDPVKRPSVPANALRLSDEYEWMLTSEHPEWVARYGNWVVGQVLTSDIGSAGIDVRTAKGPDVVHGHGAGWSRVTYLHESFGLWDVWGNRGGCGGANVVGPTKQCPMSVTNSLHSDATYVKRLYIRKKLR